MNLFVNHIKEYSKLYQRNNSILVCKPNSLYKKNNFTYLVLNAQALGLYKYTPSYDPICILINKGKAPLLFNDDVIWITTKTDSIDPTSNAVLWRLVYTTVAAIPMKCHPITSQPVLN